MTFSWPTIPTKAAPPTYEHLTHAEIARRIVGFLERWPMRTIEEIASALRIKRHHIHREIGFMNFCGLVTRNRAGTMCLYSMEKKRADTQGN